MTYTPHVWSRHDKLDSTALNSLEQAVGAFSGTADEATAAAATANTAAANAASSASAAAASAALVGAPAKSAMDAAMGGDVAGLVPAVTNKVPKNAQTYSAADQAGATMGDKIGNAVKAAIAFGAQHAEVFIPPGTWDVPPKLFSDIVASFQVGLHVRGAGRESTRLRLITGGAEAWFYDNGTTQRVNFPSFSDLCFMTDDATGQYGNGFKVTSTGHEQGWAFTRCTFRGPWRRVFQTEGTVGADTFYLDTCRILYVYDTILYINNPQSVLHQWTAVNAELIYGDIVTVGPNGGGDHKWFGGSLIMANASGSTTPHYLWNAAASSGLGSGNGSFLAVGVRLEARSAYSGLVNSPGDPGYARFVLNGCNLAGYGGGSVGAHDVVIVGRDRLVRFVDCIIPDDFTYRITVDAGNGYNTSESGIIFDSCDVPLDLSDKITLTNIPGYGRVSAHRCRARLSALTDRVAVDFDLNWMNAAYGSWGAPTKRAVLKFALAAWPGTERTLKLPSGAVITGITVRKPATGSDSSTYQLAVGNGDKSTTYGQSTSGQTEDAHTIALNGLWIECGTAVNSRTVRLWAATGSAAGVSGGIGYVEYV